MNSKIRKNKAIKTFFSLWPYYLKYRLTKKVFQKILKTTSKPNNVFAIFNPELSNCSARGLEISTSIFIKQILSPKTETSLKGDS